jgi:hypothetical protein
MNGDLLVVEMGSELRNINRRINNIGKTGKWENYFRLLKKRREIIDRERMKVVYLRKCN